MAVMDSLPPELLRMILMPDPNPQRFNAPPGTFASSVPYMRPSNKMYATHRDYLRLRLVSRIWNAIITPFAFSKIRLESPEATLDRFLAIANDPVLRHHVRTYEFAFWREPTCPGILQQEYMYIQSLQDGERDLGYAELSNPNGIDRQQRVEHYAKQLMFTRDGNMSRNTLDAISKCPNLEALAIRIGSFGATLSELPSRLFHWGPPMVETFFRALEARLSQSDCKPIRELVMEGLTMDCFLLPQDIIPLTCRGMSTLNKLTLTMSEMSEPSCSVLGRMIQSASQLKSLRISRTCDDENTLPSLQLRSLICPPRIDRSCRAKDPVPLPVVHWKYLTDLTLSECIFTAPQIIAFFQAHSQLRRLVLSHCYLQPSTPHPCPHHLHPASPAPEEEEIDPDTETWQHVFRIMHTSFDQPLQYASFSMLAAGSSDHVHLATDEAEGWADLITGKGDVEPEPSTSPTLWCTICNPNSDDEAWGWSTESESDMFDDDDDGGPIFGAGFAAWAEASLDTSDDSDSDSDSDSESGPESESEVSATNENPVALPRQDDEMEEASTVFPSQDE